MTRLVSLLIIATLTSCTDDPSTRGPDFSDPNDPEDPSDPTDPVDPPVPDQVAIALAPRAGVTGVQRINVALPLTPGKLADPTLVRVSANGSELAAARRVLARYADGSARSIQLQVDVDVAAVSELAVELGAPATAGDLEVVAVSSTLATSDGTTGPLVWARVPAAWLAASGVAGRLLPEADTTGAPATAWSGICDYATNDVDAFLAEQATTGVWLYDRGTAMYRGYARRGDQLTLESAYRETAIYRARLSGTGTATRIGVPAAADDLKYHYTQNLALHYLLTGDDRFREAAEDVATRVHALWGSPGYAGGDDFWTERHAGFGLLAYVWTAMVSDDRAAEFAALADEAADAYAAVIADYSTWPDASSRCYAHSATAHGEDFGTFGCSPWMSAILADGLDAYATERTGARATDARAAIVELGTLIARHGRDGDGRPYYWIGLDGSSEIDDFDEHWGESAYVAAMAWHWGGRTDQGLRTAVDELLDGLAGLGSAPHLRSFNWQCRSAIATSYFLQ